MAKLVLSAGGAVLLQRFIDAAERLTIGRERYNDIVVDDAAVSREHATITSVGNDHILEDLSSANGTLVNGVSATRRILQHGDVVALGGYHLRYLNPKVAAEVDLERTMYISPLAARAGDGVAQPRAGDPALSARASARTNFPRGRAWMMAGPRAGQVLELDSVVTLFGSALHEAAVLTRRPRGYYLAHVCGRRAPRVNGQSIGDAPLLVKHGDIVEVGAEKLEFTLDELDRRKTPARRRG